MPCYLLISATQITRVIMVYLTCLLVTVHCCCSVTKSFLTLYNPLDCSMPVLRYVPEFAETHVLCFTALDFTFTTGYIHNWLSFPLWPSCFILSGSINNCPLLFPSSLLGTSWPGGGGLIFFPCHIFLSFHTVHGVLMTRMLEWVAISSSNRPRFVWALHYDLSVLGGPVWHGL